MALALEEFILVSLRQPGGHTAACLSWYWARKRVPVIGLEHMCHQRGDASQIVVETLTRLVLEGTIERTGAYYFLKDAK